MGTVDSKIEGFGGTDVEAVTSLLWTVKGKHNFSASVKAFPCSFKDCSGHLFIVCPHGKHEITLKYSSSGIWRASCQC